MKRQFPCVLMVFKTIKIGASLSILLGLMLLTTNGQAAEYEITVAVDAATLSDFELMESHFAAAAEDEVPPQAMRRIIGAAIGELAMLAQSRIDDYGALSLDDGIPVTLYDRDTLMVHGSNAARVTFQTVCHPDRAVCFLRATQVTVFGPNFVKTLLLPIRGPR